MSDIDLLVDALCGPPSNTLKEIDIFAPVSKNAQKDDTVETKDTLGKPSRYSEYGQQIKEIMKSRSTDNRKQWTENDEVSGGWCSLQSPAVMQQQKNKSDSSLSFTESHSKLSVLSAQISPEDLSDKLADKTVISLNKITPSSVPNPKQGHNWVTFAVLARKLPPKESSKLPERKKKSSTFIFQHLLDLERLETLFLFGAAHEAHWKLPERTVIGLLNPDVKEDREKGQLRFTLSIDHPLKLLVLGQSRDFAVCQSHTKSGENCSKIVNKAKSEFCVYHAMTILKRGAKRPELALFGSPSFMNAAKRPRNEQSQNDMKRLASSITAAAFGPCLKPTKAPVIDSAPPGCGNASVSSSLPSASHVKSLLPSSCPGALNVQKFEEKRKKEVAPSASSKLLPAEMVDTTSWGKSMLASLEVKMNSSSSTARARRERLAALIRSGQQPAPSKVDPNKPNVECASPKANAKEVKKQQLASPVADKDLEMAKTILDTKSRHSSCVDEAFSAKQDAYFRALEPRDRAEQQLSETFKIKVKAVVCKTCLYVASSAADRCKKDHPSAVIGPIDAWRRFFACRECSFRTTTFSRFPPDPCNRCKSSRWKPAPVREIAKFHTEKLSIGVEELPQFLEGGDDGDTASGLDYGLTS